jgi:sugar phosphate isomerase/epimerase
MKLALSGRLWETSQGYTNTLTDQIKIAADLGYHGVEARYPLIPSPGELEGVRDALQQHSIELVFAPAAGVPNSEEKKADFIRVLDALKHMGARYLKQIPGSESDLDGMRLAADLGAERGIKILPQLHSNSLTDTVERCEQFFKAANHPNLGLIFDACHLPFTVDTPIEEAVQRLLPWIELVNLQSYKPSSDSDGLQHANINGRDWSLALPSDRAGTDLATAVRALQHGGYDGWLIAMPAVDPSMDPMVVARAYHDFLLPLL